jgi:predicted chitinase
VSDSIAHADSIRAANIADSLEFRRITKLINGGYNGFDDRWKLYQKAKEVLK